MENSETLLNFTVIFHQFFVSIMLMGLKKQRA